MTRPSATITNATVDIELVAPTAHHRPPRLNALKIKPNETVEQLAERIFNADWHDPKTRIGTMNKTWNQLEDARFGTRATYLRAAKTKLDETQPRKPQTT
jgi:hypothetical protein